jgi:hypothetical protein
LLIFHKERLASVKEIKAMSDFALRLRETIVRKNEKIKSIQVC